MNLNNKQKTLHLNLLQEKLFFDIELSSNCNLNCSFCPREFIKRDKKQLSESIVKRLNNWLPYECNIMFAGMGEPLLYNKIFELIDKLSNKKRIIGITTNGQLLDDSIIEKIFSSELNFLQISLNELDKNKYRLISGGYDNTNILKALNKISKKNTNNKIELQFSFVSDNLNEKEIKEQEKFSKKHNATYFSKSIHNRGGFHPLQTTTKHNDCFIFSQITFINSDGNILYCCHDLPSYSIIGNVQTHTFSEIIELKKNIIKQNKWLKQCNICNDTGREIILK